MPHCIVEYSKGLDSRVERGMIVAAVHGGAVNSGLFEPDHIRTRACVYDDYVIGYPVKDFIHVTIKIKSGRSQQQKKKLTTGVLDKLEKLGLTSLSLSVEVIDMEKETYARKIVSA